MRRYPQYRDSGDSWIGDVPVQWTVAPIKSVAKVINGFPFASDKFGPEGGMPLVRIRDLNKSVSDVNFTGDPIEVAIITKDDVLIGMDGDFNVGRWLGSLPALLNQRMCCVRGRNEAMTRLIEYCLPTPLKRINDVTYSTTVKHLAAWQVEKTKVPVPDTDEQLLAILSFLDRETAKIDALVEEQRRLIALLKEKRQAVISHAVTKGLDPAAPMKPSGIDWLGDIPAHWEARPIRHLAKLESGHTPSRSRPDWWENCYIPWFGLADVWQIRSGDVEYVSETKEQVSNLGLENSSARLLPAGTVILSRTASVGYSAIMAVPMATTQDFANWICGDKVQPEYLLYSLRAMNGEFERLKMGSTHNTIYMPDIAGFKIAVPSKEEQAEIVEHIRNKVGNLFALITEADRAITLLLERRSALISAAVTGKIDVRDTTTNSTEAA
ncbi:restriction endonuclease subunit S [Antarctobacter sp.]|uniref:restriction endonuclease subunit S n=1 Tax=Antarctobacter sp. TaxID=1872577 RepID=UPI002B27BD5D|nr:restriction endonuclease subunit S [Antarctobacter sp.]